MQHELRALTSPEIPKKILVATTEGTQTRLRGMPGCKGYITWDRHFYEGRNFNREDALMVLGIYLRKEDYLTEIIEFCQKLGLIQSIIGRLSNKNWIQLDHIESD